MTVSQVLNSLYLVNPLLAAANLALACFAHNYTFCHRTEMLVVYKEIDIEMSLPLYKSLGSEAMFVTFPPLLLLHIFIH